MNFIIKGFIKNEIVFYSCMKKRKFYGIDLQKFERDPLKAKLFNDPEEAIKALNEISLINKSFKIYPVCSICHREYVGVLSNSTFREIGVCKKCNTKKDYQSQ